MITRTMDEPIDLPGLPLALRWRPAPERWQVGEDGSLSISAGPTTDLFADPGGDAPTLNAPRLLGPAPAGDFQLSTRVTAGLAATYDAGALLLYADERSWVKLALERSPDGEALVVSVVTRGVSDDANAFAVGGNVAWLRVSRVGAAYALHASLDGSLWRFVRHFALEPADDLAVGFLAQSPTGPGCTAVFDAITLRAERLADLRSGV
jgi:regulation of enolase protein 1 (concanavalin A-like superfamily)